MSKDEKITSEIVKSALSAHEAVELVHTKVRQAIDDRRYKMTLADSRAFRDLIDDIMLMLNESWRGSLQVPLEELVEALVTNGKQK